MSQKERILEYLKLGNTLTHCECEGMFNCSRISARIDDLKNEGEHVYSRMITTRTGKHVAQYYYDESKPAPVVFAASGSDRDLFPDRIDKYSDYES